MVVAVIAFMVSVPVLSLLMTVVPPSVSTSDSDLTTALAAARRCAPDDSMVCTNVGRPTGIDAIAVDTHSSTSVVMSWPRTMPTMAITATASHAIVPNTLVMPSSSRCSGERVRLVAVTMPAIWPIWVSWPVAVTTNVAAPLVTCVFWNTMSVRSPSATSPAGRVSLFLATGALSPVSAASCTSRVARGDDPAVRGNDVARLDQRDVAGHQRGRVDLRDLAGPPHPGVRHLELGERLDARPGLHLLVGAHDDVERHQRRAPRWRSGSARWRCWRRRRSAA